MKIQIDMCQYFIEKLLSKFRHKILNYSCGGPRSALAQVVHKQQQQDHEQWLHCRDQKLFTLVTLYLNTQIKLPHVEAKTT